MTIIYDVNTLEDMINNCYDPETGEILELDEQAGKELLQEVISQGLEKLCMVRVNKQSRIEALKKEEKRIAEKRKQEEKNLDNVESYMMLIMSKVDFAKQEAGTFTVSVRKSKSVEVDDEGLVPANFLTTETVYSLDKKAIKQAIENGEDVKGCHIQENNNLTVK